eukprot:1531031-Pyramimonas_sp.AAC.1
MADCVVEMFGLDLAASYSHAFVAIRQLAVLLRQALQTKEKEAFRAVYCWQVRGDVVHGGMDSGGGGLCGQRGAPAASVPVGPDHSRGCQAAAGGALLPPPPAPRAPGQPPASSTSHRFKT